MARRLNPRIYIIARTRFLPEVKPLYELGVNEVIREEFETSVEIFTRVLGKYLIPRDEIEKFIAEVRADGYGMFRSLSRELHSFSDLRLHLPNFEISRFRIDEGSSLAGKSLAEIALRKKYGGTLLAIRRDSKILSDIGGETAFRTNDILVLLAPPEKIAAMTDLFHDSEKVD
jgi:CPA2 family monovalent cation:H+ antiporter-2